MKLVVAGMHRTGHHPIAIWLLHQQQGISNFSINSLTQWLFLIKNGSELSVLANNPIKQGVEEHSDKEKFDDLMWDIKPDLLIATHEREKLTDVALAFSQSPTFTNKNKPRLVVVLRDFRNWVASCVKMAERDNKPTDMIIDSIDIDTYADHLDWYSPIGSTTFIKYNNWVVDPEYRRKVAEKLNLKFTDASLDQLSIFGGGSSFDGMDYIKTATKMNVTQSYKQMEGNFAYEAILREYKDLLQESDDVLGVP